MASFFAEITVVDGGNVFSIWHDFLYRRQLAFGAVWQVYPDRTGTCGFHVPYFLNSASPRTKQACLLSAMLLTGGLMALFGQTYQTGADPCNCFLTGLC